MLKNSFIKVHILKLHIEIVLMRQFQCEPLTYDTENKEICFRIYTYQVSLPLSPFGVHNGGNYSSLILFKLIAKVGKTRSNA